MAYTKLFSSITASTIWNAPDHTRLVWITMLAMGDRDGYVAASVPGLAVQARVPIESVVIALESFTSPDKWSRTKDFDGRRIKEVDGGWVLLNYDKYREQQSVEDVREKTAARVRRHRERKALRTVTVTECNASNDIAEESASASPSAAASGGIKPALPIFSLDCSALFADLYVAHPNKSSRVLGEQALCGVISGATDQNLVAERIRASHAAWVPEFQRDGGKFAPRLDRWLQEGRWMDDPPAQNEPERGEF